MKKGDSVKVKKGVMSPDYLLSSDYSSWMTNYR